MNLHKRNLAKLDIDAAKFQNMDLKKVFLIGDIALLTGHVLYLILFVIFGVKQMAIVNIFSVLIYSSIAFLINVDIEPLPLMFVAAFEVMIHACLGLYYLGWNNGFGLFLLFLIPFPFYMPLKRLITPYLLAVIPVSLFMTMRFLFGSSENAVYQFETHTVNDSIYFLNVILGTGMLIYVSSIYMLNRELMHDKLRRTNLELIEQANIDPLTELFNRRAMMEFLLKMQKDCRSSGNGYVLGIGDIDDFKLVNDTYGHNSGDVALKYAAQVMAEIIPAEGYTARWGGEEFLFVIPSCDTKTAECYAEKIRRTVHANKISSDGSKFEISVTIGICASYESSDFEKLISIADSRLYKGKKSGKNCVITE